MRKTYQTPEIEIKKFSLRSDILDNLPSETEVRTSPPDDMDSTTSTYSLKDSIGFGW